MIKKTTTNTPEPVQKFAPSDIKLSKSDIDENQPVGTVVGDLTTVDEDSETHTYSLDSDDFEIVNNQLKSKIVFDFETKSSYLITISSKDDDGKIFIKKFTITINYFDPIAPTDISLSKNNIDESKAAGSVVGVLSSTDTTKNDSFTYSLVAGAGADDNASFEIDGNNLKAKTVFDFETKASYKVRIQTVDKGGNTFEKAFTININNLNNEPTDIALSSASINENTAIATVIGSLSTTDPTVGDAFTYSLVAGAGGDDNASFEIDGNNLKTKAVFDFETKASYKVRIQTVDKLGNAFQKAFTITVNNITESISYAYNSGSKYLEATANDGSIDSSKFITVTVVGLTFKGNNGDTLTKNTDFTTTRVERYRVGAHSDNIFRERDVETVPSGLTMVVTKLSDTTAKITFTGRADNHFRSSTVDNSVNNIHINFKNSAFAHSPNIANITGKDKKDIAIEYTYEPPSFRYEYTAGDALIESGISAGQIDGIYVLKVFVDNGSFIGAGGSDFVSNTHFRAKNVPNGLTIKMTRQVFNTTDIFNNTVSTNLLAVYFGGTATSHASSDDVSNIEIEFLSAALTGNPDLSAIASKKKSDVKIKFDVIYANPSSASIFGETDASAISEKSANDGSFPTSDQNIWIRGASTITSVANGAFFTDDNSYYTVTGMPAGLSLRVENSTGKIRISLTGQATGGNANSDSKYVTVKLLPKMFQGSPLTVNNPYRVFIVPIKFND